MVTRPITVPTHIAGTRTVSYTLDWYGIVSIGLAIMAAVFVMIWIIRRRRRSQI